MTAMLLAFGQLVMAVFWIVGSRAPDASQAQRLIGSAFGAVCIVAAVMLMANMGVTCHD